MLFETIGQHRVFLWMMAAGMLIGAWYALTAGLRRLMGAGVWLSLVCDVIFGLGAGALFCATLCGANHGALRGYTALAAALGFGVFAMGAYPPGRGAIRAMKCAVSHIFVKIRRFR